MKIKIKLLVMACVLGTSLLVSTNVFAFQITDNQVVDSNKKWTLTFTGSVGFDDATKQAITVTDSKGNKANINFELGSNNKSVIVDSPTGGYTTGESYTLTIGKQAHSSMGIQMKQDRTLHFKIKENNDISQYTVNVENSSIIGCFQKVTVSLPSNIDSSQYDVIIKNEKAEFEDGKFNVTLIGCNLNQDSVRQYIQIQKKNTTPTVTISKINNINSTVTQNGSYKLPTTVQATMSDGSTKNIAVTWDKQVDTSRAGTFIFNGTVNGYSSNVVLTLTVNASDTDAIDLTNFYSNISSHDGLMVRSIIKQLNPDKIKLDENSLFLYKHSQENNCDIAISIDVENIKVVGKYIQISTTNFEYLDTNSRTSITNSLFNLFSDANRPEIQIKYNEMLSYGKLIHDTYGDEINEEIKNKGTKDFYYSGGLTDSDYYQSYDVTNGAIEDFIIIHKTEE